MRYWDTSALLKLYVTEAESARFRGHAANTGPLLIGEIARWELFAAIQRKEAAGDISPGTSQFFYNQFETDIRTGRIVVTGLDGRQFLHFQNTIRNLYQQKPALLVRTLDALHLAAALTGHVVEFVTGDARQAQAAAALNLPLFV